MARSLILNPAFMILDEPTSALDRSIQIQVIELLKNLQKEFELTYLFISHDLKVVRSMSDYIFVMRPENLRWITLRFLVSISCIHANTMHKSENPNIGRRPDCKFIN